MVRVLILMHRETYEANAVSHQPGLQLKNSLALLISKQHAAATFQSQSPVCERTCGELGKGGWEETD